MQQPLVSIIIPVYNGSNYLQEAIESALEQTYPNIEVLVVNDGSDDGGKTEAIALSYREKVRYFHKENAGVASALNVGIQNMSGEYFSWLSHDDVYYPDKIQKEIDCIFDSGNPQTIVHCEYDFYDENTGSKTSTNFHEYYSVEQITNSVFPVLQIQIHACGALIHRSHFERVGYFNEKILTVQDIEMWFRLLRKQKSLFVPESLYMVREHSEAGSKTISGYYMETCKLYMHLIDQMSNEEMEYTFGSAWRFLVRMAGFVKSYRGDFSALENRLAACKPSVSDIRNLNVLKQRLGIKSGAVSGMYIFGAGQYGIRMHYEMDARGIPVAGFIDNNTDNQGKIIDGLQCYLPQDIAKGKGLCAILVAARNCNHMVAQLKQMGISNFLTRQEIDGILSKG